VNPLARRTPGRLVGALGSGALGSGALASGAVALGALAGCADDGDPGPQPTVTQTVLVTGSGEPTGGVEEEGGDVADRSFDVGTVVEVREGADGGVTLVLDRWTVAGVDDATLAQEGVAVVPHDGSRYSNQNTDRTYLVPVADDVQVVVNECEPPATEGAAPGLSSRQGTLEDFLALPDRAEEVVLLAYTDGELTRLDTDPRC
jgi:hypothetical protein